MSPLIPFHLSTRPPAVQPIASPPPVDLAGCRSRLSLIRSLQTASPDDVLSLHPGSPTSSLPPLPRSVRTTPDRPPQAVAGERGLLRLEVAHVDLMIPLRLGATIPLARVVESAGMLEETEDAVLGMTVADAVVASVEAGAVPPTLQQELEAVTPILTTRRTTGRDTLRLPSLSCPSWSLPRFRPRSSSRRGTR